MQEPPEPPDLGPDEEPSHAACTLNPDGVERTVVQCNGELRASISFDTIIGDCANTLGDPGWCTEAHSFGLGFDAYEQPAVMACCEPDRASEAELLRYCAVDLAEQICRSIPTRLDMLIDEGLIKVGKPQARALRDYLNKNQDACFMAFNHRGANPGELAPGSWLVAGGGNSKWPSLKNFRINLEVAAVSSTSVPESPDEWLACEDANFNNTEIFEETVPVSPGIHDVAALAEAAPISISGPALLGNRVVGSGALAADHDCMDPRCATLELSEDLDAGLWTLEELELYADGEVRLRSGEVEVVVADAALRLYGVAEGLIRSGAGAPDTYYLPPGAAHFVISGASMEHRDVRWASNATAILARKQGRGWVVDRFDVVHVDGAGERWTIGIPSTSWD